MPYCSAHSRYHRCQYNEDQFQENVSTVVTRASAESAILLSSSGTVVGDQLVETVSRVMGVALTTLMCGGSPGTTSRLNTLKLSVSTRRWLKPFGTPATADLFHWSVTVETTKTGLQS